MTLILLQLALLLVTAWGWGFWLSKIRKPAPSSGWKGQDWFFFGLGGFAACILVLHALVYCNLPLKWSAWIALLVAAAGVLGSLLTRPPRPGRWHRYRRRDATAASVVFATIFALQGASLFHAGPENYYGNAHADQFNYVALAEFLVEKPFRTSLGDVGLQPWLAKPVALKSTRLGQSVANGYLGVVSRSDAKGAYGTLSIFMVAVAALSVFILARALFIPRVLATIIGLWWGVLPAITKMHLDGFFSQTCVLCIFPAMAALFFVRRGRIEQASLVLLTLYLGYLLCTYTEVYVLGLGLLGSLFLLAARPGTSWAFRGLAAGVVVAGSLLLTGGYLWHFFHYAVLQYGTAADPRALADIVPMSGTWTGWAQIFTGYAPLPDAGLARWSVPTCGGLALIAGGAFLGRGRTRGRWLVAMIAPPIGVLAILFCAAVFRKYPFSKLLDTFTTFWLVLFAVGLLRLGALLTRRRLVARMLAGTVAGVFALLALRGSWPQWRAVCEDQGVLAAVDSAQARLCYAAARHEPAAEFLILEPHNILCGWLAYAARRSHVYVAGDLLSDLPVPATVYAFRHWPEFARHLVVLGSTGPRQVSDYARPPRILVNNPQGSETDGASVWYWIGPDVTIELTSDPAQGNFVRRYLLQFDAGAGPSNPTPDRTLALVDPEGNEQTAEFNGTAKCSFEVAVRPGKNLCVLKVAAPTEQTVQIPADARKLMVRVQNFSLTDLRLLR